jgi:outer membrane protein assembly factor BamB
MVYGMPATEADGRAPDPMWGTPTHGAVTADLVVSGEELFVSSQDGFLYCLDRITGKVKWSAPHETPLADSAAATKGAVYQSRGGEVWCHDRATGAVRWKHRGSVRFVVERDGKSVLEGTDGSLVSVDDRGRVTGTMPSGGFTFPTNVEDGSLYGVAADGYLYKLEVGGE